MEVRPVILSIAGYDPSSGAGVTADVKTAAALDCYAVTCPTALTIQSTQGVFGVEPIRPEVVSETLRRLADDVEIAAVRIGMLGTGEVVAAVAEFLEQRRPPNVVLDPVLRSSSGASLVDDAGITLIRNKLLPIVDFVTPNFEEGAALAGVDIEATWPAKSAHGFGEIVWELAEMLHQMGSKSVVITGVPLPEMTDFLSVCAGEQRTRQAFEGSWIASRATHGTGCAFATAIACGLAHGKQAFTAVQDAKDFVRRAISAAYAVGKGTGPMNHLFRLGEPVK
jgi:hydroxymethylpyrimidine/phosphomethylpyrimidine kinase